MESPLNLFAQVVLDLFVVLLVMLFANISSGSPEFTREIFILAALFYLFMWIWWWMLFTKLTMPLDVLLGGLLGFNEAAREEVVRRDGDM